MNALMLVGGLMIVGPAIAAGISVLLSNKEPSFVERHMVAWLIIGIVSAVIGSLLFCRGAGWY